MAYSRKSPTRSSRESQFFWHTLEHFFTLSYSLPLQESHLNTELLIAEIQANLARNKSNKMVDKNSTLHSLPFWPLTGWLWYLPFDWEEAPNVTFRSLLKVLGHLGFEGWLSSGVRIGSPPTWRPENARGSQWLLRYLCYLLFDLFRWLWALGMHRNIVYTHFWLLVLSWTSLSPCIFLF